MLESEVCPCGRGMPVLADIAGRTADLLTAEDGRIVHGTYFPQLFRNKEEVARYQVHQTHPRRLVVRLVCNRDVTPAWLEALRAEIQARFGPATDVAIQIVDNIPLTPAGKHRMILSDVAAQFGSRAIDARIGDE